jgi:hypothetical protein
LCDVKIFDSFFQFYRLCSPDLGTIIRKYIGVIIEFGMKNYGLFASSDLFSD